MSVPSAPPPELYLNRELSQLAFNARVLELAEDASLPLLERFRFLSIATSNLDEFFEIRVAGLQKQVEVGGATPGLEGLTPQEVLGRISIDAHAMVDRQYRLLQDELLPGLVREKIRLLRKAEWSDEQAEWVRRYFEGQLLPVVSPIRLDPAHPFPRVLNKALHFIIEVEGQDAFGSQGGMAVLNAPRHLPRLLRLPGPAGSHDFALLSAVIQAHAGDLFPGMSVTSCHSFRVTRNSELLVDSEEVEDLRSALQGELTARRYGDEVRLEVSAACPETTSRFLLEQFDLGEADLYRLDGPLNLGRLIVLPDLVDRPDLKYPAFSPSLPPRLTPGGDLFAEIAKNDVLLHHPFHSFTVVLDLLRQAAADPDVVAIKQTLYRAGEESVLEDALLSAAHAGKVVTVVVELRARFDEAANISLADRLAAAGAQVVYGVVGYKTHAKMLMVVRREGGVLKRYVHLATGNYHARTARLYTDLGLLTCAPEIGEDVHKIFLQLTGLGATPDLKKLLQAPFGLRPTLLRYIGNEATAARAGKPARIVAKMNSLTDPAIIEALCDASRAGVEIDLVVRGICCLRPGVQGASEKVRVRSVLGRFLEHTRIFYFENGGTPRVLLGSADWMVRNMQGRVEICFPIEDPKLRQQALDQALWPYLKDEAGTWLLDKDGRYQRLVATSATPFSVQASLISAVADGGAPILPEDTPRRRRSQRRRSNRRAPRPTE
jgi:polyphosphate kinase